MPPPDAPSRLRAVPILIAHAFGVGCGIAGVKINSRLLPADTLGRYGVFLTLAPIGAWFLYAGLIKFAARHWAATGNRAALWRELVRRWTRRLGLLALCTTAGALALRPEGLAEALVLIVALFLAAALLALAGIAQAGLQADRAHWRDCSVSTAASLTRTILPPALFALTGSTLALWTGFLTHAIVAGGVAWLALRATLPAPGAASSELPAFDRVYDGPLFLILAFSTWALAGINRWFVALFFGETEAGYFTLTGGAAVVVVATIGTVCMQYLQPGFFALGDKAETRGRVLASRVDLAALTFVVLAAGALSAFHFVAPSLVGPLIDPQYRNALPWIVPAGCFTIATMTTVFFHSMLLAGRRERGCAATDLITAAVLGAGGLGAVALGRDAFVIWLMVTPFIPWALTRPLARHFLFKPDASPAPESGPAKTSA